MSADGRLTLVQLPAGVSVREFPETDVSVGLHALGSFSTVVEMLHEAALVVDVAHDGMFPNAGKRGVKVSADSRSGTGFLEFRDLLFLTRKTEPYSK